MEIQYLKGRLDELHKAIPTVIDLHRSRKLDMRLQKYYDKLKRTNEIAYYLYSVERHNQHISKQKSQNNIKELLESIIPQLGDAELINKIKNQISKY